MHKCEGEIQLEPVDANEPSFQNSKDEAYIRLFDYYTQRLLSREEAEAIAHQLASAQSLTDLQNVESDIPFQQARSIFEIEKDRRS